MKIAILGYGTEGQAALAYWQKPENQLTVCDQNDVAVPDGVAKKTGSDYLADLHDFDLLVRSPGLYPGDITKANPDSPGLLDKVTTVTNEFMRVCPSKNIIGVTGTKGKGTTSTLIASLLKAAGKTVHLGGNIGLAPLEMLKAGIQAGDWVVLEMSSFQLIDIKQSPHIGVCVMIVPEHLNWHADMDEYVKAKQQLFIHQTTDDIAVFNRANAHSQEVAGVSMGEKISYEVPSPGVEPRQTTGAYLKGDTIFMNQTPVCQVADVALLGRHNLENVCAAIAATWETIGEQAAVVQRVVREFKGLPHRLELVREVNGVKYYNDSFAATPEAAMAALDSVPGSKIMIAGGFDRDLELDNLAQMFAHHQADIRKVFLVGQSAKRLAKNLDQVSFDKYEILPGDVTMPQIVEATKTAASNGDSVVLSPGFPSFDMFKNFEDRGTQFQTAVKAL